MANELQLRNQAYELLDGKHKALMIEKIDKEDQLKAMG